MLLEEKLGLADLQKVFLSSLFRFKSPLSPFPPFFPFFSLTSSPIYRAKSQEEGTNGQIEKPH